MRVVAILMWSLAIAICGEALAPHSSIPTKKPNLHFVKKIYVGENDWSTLVAAEPSRRNELEKAAADEKVINTYLAKLLTDAGFTTVKSEEESDAVLKGTIGISIVFDGGDPPDPPEYTFMYLLWTPRVKNSGEGVSEIWRAEIPVRSKTYGPELFQRGAARVVSRLVKDWTKSANKEGIKTINKNSIRS